MLSEMGFDSMTRIVTDRVTKTLVSGLKNVYFGSDEYF